MPESNPELDVAIVGMGPRGLSVLERLLIRSADLDEPVTVRIWTFDPAEHGAGRIWRTDQPDWFMMNTVTGEVSMYSGKPDGGPARAGSGPSLHEWLAGHDDPRWSALGASDYAPRAVYGQYLRSVFDSLVANRPDNATVHSMAARIDRIEPCEGRARLVTDTGQVAAIVDKVVLTTGHPRNAPDQREWELASHAGRRDALRYIRGDSAADMELAPIDSAERVGVIGLGLTFFDVTMALTVGRGGEFETTSTGALRYVPSGREPRIFAGSRSGLPMLARGRNQKPPTYRYQPKFATSRTLAAARERALRRTGTTQLDFRTDVLPLLRLEVEHIYYMTLVRHRLGLAAAETFARHHLANAGPRPDIIRKLLSEYGIAEAAPIDLEKLARPFGQAHFEGTDDFHATVLTLLRQDLGAAELGNVHGPLKGALDILRDIRGFVRAAVDFGGLRPVSHRDDFLDWFNPINTMLSAGPPPFRIAQTCALIEAGVLSMVGPAMAVGKDDAGLVLSSPKVGGTTTTVTTLIDARIPQPSIRADSSPLTRQLLAEGLISEFVNIDPVSGDAFATGAVATTGSPFHIVGAVGQRNPDMYALGVPTENHRWFTQIGNGRPGPLTGFHADADAIALDILAKVPKAVPQPTRRRGLVCAGNGAC